MSADRDRHPHDLPSYAADDVGLTLPLRGGQLIEASAGTGKTFTLTTLVLRLLLERGALMPDILAVTFTRAATQDLRQRIRRRLRLARRLLDAPEFDGLAKTEPVSAAAPDGETVATCAVLRGAMMRDGAERVRQRLDAALLQLDEAMVSTIHGFCHRAAREFGFHAGQLAAATVVDDVGDVWDEVAAQVWRRSANVGDAHLGDEVHALLASVWKTPQALAADLPALCDPMRVMYPRRDDSAAATALHALRDAAMHHFDAAIARRGECSQDQLIERVWRASAMPEVAVALAKRWPWMLIDEFQDTDPRQWDIFRRMHEAGDPERRWLCLIGDPKQAIYRFRGGDLETYLKARDDLQSHAVDGNPIAVLHANYRSTPAVLRAIDTLFTANPNPFVDERIAFQTVRAAGAARDDDLHIEDAQRGDTVVPGMTLHWLSPADAQGGMRLQDDETAMMADVASRVVADLLTHGRLRDGDAFRNVHPGDIAVLTQTNRQVPIMQRALASLGVAAASLSRHSVFAGDTARALHALLLALVEPADTGRLRAALATPILGWNAGRIAALDDDDHVAQAQYERFNKAAEDWRTRGPLQALLPFVTEASPRWLRESGGTRRVTDALHLIELLQAQSAGRHSVAEQLAWFSQQCAAPSGEESRQLRLEADGGLVQISTVHLSKGLEYPIVVLPFVATRSKGGGKARAYDDFRDTEGRPARIWRAKGVLEAAQSQDIETQVAHEEQAEAQRQLYVALTRAKHAVHVVWSRNRNTDATAMHWLLHAGERTGRAKDTLDHAGMRARIDALADASAGSIAIAPHQSGAVKIRNAAASVPAPTPQAQPPSARSVKRRLQSAPFLHSFSSLHARLRDDEMPIPLRGADDEQANPSTSDDDAIALGGTAFGNVVHAVLELTEPAAWEADFDASGVHSQAHLPASERPLIEHALRHHGLPVTVANIAQTARLVMRAVNTVLPGDIRLCTLPAQARVREMPFHFRLGALRTEHLQRWLEQSGYPRVRPLATHRIEGLMQGYIDLVYRDGDGRHYVADYKTNRLPAYDEASLRQVIAAQDYDLQYLIYLVALYRWLRLRRGAAFDPSREIGGAVYLFLRGMTPGGIEMSSPSATKTRFDVTQARGVHFDPVPAGRLAELDALFEGAVFGGDGP